MIFTCALRARVTRIKSTKTEHKSIVNRAPIWGTIKQLKPTRHVTMKELYILQAATLTYIWVWVRDYFLLGMITRFTVLDFTEYVTQYIRNFVRALHAISGEVFLTFPSVRQDNEVIPVLQLRKVIQVRLCRIKPFGVTV